MIHNLPIIDNMWLIFFYSVPSKPVNLRMKTWRRLAKVGAVQLKDAVYILPYSEEHHEFLQWLSSEIASTGGESAFIKTEKIETMKQQEIIELFDRNRKDGYSQIEKGLDELERKASSIRKGSSNQQVKTLTDKINKLFRDFEEIRKRDFFSSKAGADLHKRLTTIETEIKGLLELNQNTLNPPITAKHLQDYQGKRWVTRKRPFVDRMASAWLIKKFIDQKATFGFIDEEELGDVDKDVVAFDLRSAEFTHQMDMCTFEVLVKAFRLKSKALKDIAEIVHELDLKDDKYKNPEVKGVEKILTGIRKTEKDDIQALEKGMLVFEMLYASRG